jgi:hypothetical protein
MRIYKMNKDEALKMAIKALEDANDFFECERLCTPYDEAINACKEALEQQPAQSTNEHSDELAEVLIALKDWVINAENRLAKLEQALKEKNHDSSY